MGWFKSEDEKWAEAKQRAHEYRAENGQRMNKSRKSYTANEKVNDQRRVSRAANKRRGD